MAKNTLKKDIENEAEEAAPKSAKNRKNTANGGRFGKILAFVQDARVRKIGGIFIVLFSIYSLIAFISYLFTGIHDERLINAVNTEHEPYRNFMGKIGAMLAWFFMNRNLGVGALFISFVSFLWGIRIWLRRDLLPFWKSVRLSALGMLYFPAFIAFIFHQTNPVSGQIELNCNQDYTGAWGYFAASWGIYTLGKIGTFLLFAFTACATIIFNLNHQVESFWNRFITWWQTKNDDVEEEEEVQETTAKVEITPDKKKRDKALSNIPLVPEELAVADVASKPPTPETTVEVNFDEKADYVEETSEDVQEEEVIEPAAAIAPVVDLSDLGIELEAPVTEEELSEAEIDNKVQEFGLYDPKLDLSRYELPSIELLKPHGASVPQINKEELEENKNKIIETLNNYKIEIAKIKATVGPTVTLYEIVPAPGVRISRIKSLEDDIALSLSALGIRIIAPIPGKGTIGIEVPNSKPDIVSMRSLIASDKFQNADMELPVILGRTIQNENFVTDLAKMPHLLMAGATGQGKSVGLNAILVSLLYKKHPSQIKFVLVDPKKVELTLFNKIERHFLAKLPDEEEAIITDTQKVVKTLQSLCVEMDHRYELLKNAGCRNIKEYNAKFVSRRLNPENGHRYLPYIVLVVDEFADLIMTAGREVETPIARLAQLARAIGIHLIIATQRPSVNIITGVIKANFPARIAFRVTSKIDSRTILDAGGADQLIGRGDMLFSTGNDLIRIQCGFVDTPEVEEITDFIGSQQAYPSALLLPEVADENGHEVSSFADEDRDELFEEAAKIIVLAQQGSASLLQRKLKLGYNRAGRLIDQLEAAGIIGPFEGSKARKVLFHDEFSLEQFLKNPAQKQPF